MSTDNLLHIALAHISMYLEYFVPKEKLFSQLKYKISESPMNPCFLRVQNFTNHGQKYLQTVL